MESLLNCPELKQVRSGWQSRGSLATTQFRPALERGAQRILEETARFAPASFGPFFSARVFGGGALLTASVTMDVRQKPHAVFVNFGTRPHPIVPVTAAVLRWTQPQLRFAAYVFHPGTKAVHFMERGFTAGLPFARAELRGAWEAVNRARRA